MLKSTIQPLLPQLFVNCHVNGDKFALIDEVVNTLRLVNDSALFHDKIERLKQQVKYQLRQQSEEHKRLKEAASKNWNEFNSSYEEEAQLDSKIRYALAVS